MASILIILMSSPVFTITTQELKLEILSKVAHGLFSGKDIYIYLADNSFIGEKIKTGKLGLIFVDNCSSANLVVAKSLKNLPRKCLKKPIFATNYPLYRDKHTIGALFWQKGRPVLIIKKKALEIRHMRVKKYLAKYLQ